MLSRALAFILLCLAPVATFGFGQNKVQYHSFEWSYYQTEHFDVYFPQGGEPIARFAAERVEEMYARVSGIVGHKLTARVPIILHNTHAEFEQTNVIPMALHEGIGGFTERFKNRIVLPFEGSYRDFYHVLQHEMVHALVFNMLFGGDSRGPVSQQIVGFPLWVNEGLAEYASLGWDLNSEFFMIDATTFGYVAPPVTDFGGFLAYKGGQQFFHFMETVYGKGTVTRFIQNLATMGDMRKAFQKTTKTSLEEAGEIWLRELRHLYWPELGQRQYGKSVARRLTHHGRDRSFYNLQPSLSPNGEEIAFFSDRESWEAVYILNVKTEKVTRAVIQGGMEGEHESFHSFKSGITWSPDGKSLAVVSKQGGKDVIHLLDAGNGKVKRVLKPDVASILSPNWSRDGKRIAFSGQRDGFADIYVYDLDADSARRLTFDMAHDDKPVFSPSGRWIAFESDRPGTSPRPSTSRGEYDALLPFKDLYRISAQGDSLSLLAGGPWDEKMPSYGPSDSSLVFVSNRSGLDNIYLWKDSAGATIRPLTNLLTGCFTPSWSQDGKQIAFSLFEAGGWDIYLMKDPLAKVLETLPKTRFIQASEDSTAGFFRPPNFENLNSYNADSLRAAAIQAEKEKKKKEKEAKKNRGKKAAGDTLIPAAEYLATRADTARADSARKADSTKVAPAKTLSRKDSLKIAKDSTKAAADSAKARRLRAKKEAELPFLRDTSFYKNDSGFIERDYKTKWSFDGASAAVGVDNQYGAGGLAYLTLSDLMGDQQLAFAISINGSLENTSGVVQYAYLPHRIDYSVTAFRESQDWIYQNVYGQNSFSYENESRGFGVAASYPFSPFTRVEAGMFTRFSTRTITDVVSRDSTGRPDSIFVLREVVNSLLPGAAWVHDNAQWGIVGPVAGRRMMAGVQYLPPVLQDDFSYVKAEVDLRFYKELYKRYTFAFRVSGGASEAVSGYENPHTYAVGGESYTFNAAANYDNVPATMAEFYFSDLDFPLRGYEFYDFRGTRKFLTNAEFRFPFVQQLAFAWPIPFAITNVMGTLFVDWGGAWSSGDPFSQMGLGLGYGLRLNLGVFILKYTYAESIHGVGGYTRGPRHYWSLGSEF
jgi:Tol biopolymer transport system component